MAKPIINGIGICVHKVNNFSFTVDGSNFDVGDTIRIAHSIAGVKYEWLGSITARLAGTDTYVAEISQHPSNYPGSLGDIGDAVITITSAGGETSLAHQASIVIDDP